MEINRGVSVIICCYNSTSRLLPTLTAISKQSFNSQIKWELILIDNASTDGTADYAIKILSSFPTSYRIIEELRPGLMYARQRAIQESCYEYLLFCDDDNWLDEYYVQNAYEIMYAHPTIGVLGGWGKPVYESEPPEWFIKMNMQYATGRQADKSGVVPFDLSYVYGAGSIYRKRIFEFLNISQFKFYLTGRKGSLLLASEDVELGYLVTLLNYQVWFSDVITFNHFIENKRLTWKYALQNAYGHGYSRAFLRPYQEIMFGTSYNLFFDFIRLIKDVASLTKNSFNEIARRHCLINLYQRLGEISAYTKSRSSIVEQSKEITQHVCELRNTIESKNN